MKPIVAIVGRPNVGKSTLFNRIIGERKAIVLDTPGVTRDRNFGDAHWQGKPFTVVDTGGFEPESEDNMLAHMRAQAMLAIEEAEIVVFVLDARDGLLDADREVAGILRRAERPVVYVVNKIDGHKQEALAAEFFALGVDDVHAISAEHGRGVGRLLDTIAALLPEPDDDADGDDEERVTRVALIGRPNAGKSTLANRLLGENRMIVDATPGTTRDAIDARMRFGDREYLLIDTAGLRRKKKIEYGTSEGFSAMRTLKAIDRCHVAVCMMDATDGITDQDARVVGVAAEKGRAIVIAVNKWDAVDKDHKTAQRFQELVERQIPFASFAPVVFISGMTGQRIPKLIEAIDRVRESHLQRIGTGQLNRWLEDTLARHQPPVVGNRRLKFYYATQARVAPPTIVLSCNDPEAVHFSYQRFLVNQFRETFDVVGTPVRLHFRGKVDRHDEE
ncbi:MAG: ribosome biogenesis GTPase Der [bacterium]